MFTVGTPIVETMYNGLIGDIDTRGLAANNVLMLLWYGVPVLIDVLTGVWFLLVLTKRQPVTQGVF
jgi:hypothetical protein